MGVGQHGGRTPAAQGVASCGGGCSKENGRPYGGRWPRYSMCARDVGGALIGVELRRQPQRQPQAAELLGYMMAL